MIGCACCKLWDIVLTHLSQRICTLHQELSIDKALIPFQGRLGFKLMDHQNGQACNVVCF